MSSTGETGAAAEKDFFVSYTAVDREWAEWIAWQLEEASYQVLVQAWDFVPGTNWMVGMQQGLQECRQMIAVLSTAYLGSVYGAQEWRAAERADAAGFQRKLVPVRIEECDQPGMLRPIRPVDLFDRDAPGARAALLDGIAAAGEAEPAGARRSAPTVRAGRPAIAPRFPGAAGRFGRGADRGLSSGRSLSGPRGPRAILLGTALGLAVAVIAVTVLLVADLRPGRSAGPLATATSPAGVPVGAGCGTGLGKSYDIPSGAGSRDIVVQDGGFVTQEFIARGTCATWVGAIVGCNPGILKKIGSARSCPTDNSSFGTIEIQILDQDTMITRVRVATADNATGGGYLEPPVRLTPGRAYLLKTINRTGIPAGFLFKPGDTALSTTISGAFFAYQNGSVGLNQSAIVDNQP
jgi:hypothetical protein